MNDHKFYEMLGEYVKEDSLRHEQELQNGRKKKYFIKLIIIGVFLTFLSFFLYLIFTLKKSEEAIESKNAELIEMKQDLQAALYEQYFYEEEAEKYKSLLIHKFPEKEIDLKDNVSQNLENIKKIASAFHGENIYRGNINNKNIALTFDLASGEDLDAIYHYLNSYNIKITIFISNEKPGEEGSLTSRTNVQLIKKMAKMDGKVEFGNHTWSHYNHYRSLMETSFKKRKMMDNISDEILDIPSMENEVSRVKDRFKEITTKELANIYRLPYGSLNQLILNSYASFGYNKHIMWSYNSYGSLDLPDYIMKKYIYKKSETGSVKLVKNPFYKTKEEVLAFLNVWEEKDPNGMNGAIILMHLGTPRKHDKLIEILPEFIKRMQEKKYHFVTISEVLDPNVNQK